MIPTWPCALFILWRRADALQRVYSLLAHHLKSITNQNEHQIRLSKDDNPPAHKFLVDDYGDDNGHLNNSDDELLLKHVKQATQALRHRTNDE
ncbi:hypothetical protein K443DRAFT_91828 [Laccaria amethystina LaAM-08-1]|uniref:Uncharacterized protein n=1 Tax=Laccaria amethystina LaAM-08-1 TaxID=1095629 RepID=A0A0C9Y4U4_9AGAR|nr:hypothetical protein K443DRAFT_91828 [Laccaria amethystina LaAM-08-1]